MASSPVNFLVIRIGSQLSFSLRYVRSVVPGGALRTPALKSVMTLVTYSSSSRVHFPLRNESLGIDDKFVFFVFMSIEGIQAGTVPHFPPATVLSGFVVAVAASSGILVSGQPTVDLEASSSTLLGLTGLDTSEGMGTTSCGCFRLATNLGDSSSDDASPVLEAACFLPSCFARDIMRRSFLSASVGTTVDMVTSLVLSAEARATSTAFSESAASPAAVVGLHAAAVIGSLA